MGECVQHGPLGSNIVKVDGREVMLFGSTGRAAGGLARGHVEDQPFQHEVSHVRRTQQQPRPRCFQEESLHGRERRAGGPGLLLQYQSRTAHRDVREQRDVEILKGYAAVIVPAERTHAPASAKWREFGEQDGSKDGKAHDPNADNHQKFPPPAMYPKRHISPRKPSLAFGSK